MSYKAPILQALDEFSEHSNSIGIFSWFISVDITVLVLDSKDKKTLNRNGSIS